MLLGSLIQPDRAAECKDREALLGAVSHPAREKTVRKYVAY